MKQENKFLPLDFTKPLRCYGGEPKLVTAIDGGKFVFDLAPHPVTAVVRTVVVDRRGCIVGQTTRTVWNLQDVARHCEPLKIGEKVYLLRLGKSPTARTIVKGVVRKFDERGRMLVEVAGHKNRTREDGLLVTASGSCYKSLDEIEKKLNKMMDDFCRFKAAEAPANIPSIEPEARQGVILRHGSR